MDRQEQTLYLIALSKVEGIGNARVKKLVAYCGGPKEVFAKPASFLNKIPSIGAVLTNAVKSSDVLRKAEEELAFADKNRVNAISFLDVEYPQRLKHCDDSPIVLYAKGNGSINPSRCVSIVGTRNATRQGKEITEAIVEELAKAQITIVSGLAYGIDIAAHRACLKFNVPTIGCLAHGLDRMYPKEHSNTATEMLEKGALITDFPIGTNPDRENFPKRNRIVAGMADATIVVEAGIKGGALITADLAFDYSRDVFAVPGRIGDEYSAGCNRLIMSNKAALITSGSDVLKAMSWDVADSKKKPQPQTKLLIDLTEEQEKVVAVLREKEHTIDRLAVLSGFPMSKVASVLLELEFEGIVSNLPGKIYKLN
ncbi:MAG: DNA-processing protein DprA [Flavobacteriales bacterium]|nr:DNA-processing protein DprA [Flavobacteriales bacterium]